MSTTTTTATGGTGPSVPPQGEQDVQKGWAYAMRPPRWPVARTPRQRGGVRASAGTATVTHVVLCAEDNAERIFFVKACDKTGKDVACDFVVEAVPREGTAPQEVTIKAGTYVERRLDPTGAGWTGLSVKKIDALPPGDPVLARYLEVVRQATGGGGGRGGRVLIRAVQTEGRANMRKQTMRNLVLGCGCVGVLFLASCQKNMNPKGGDGGGVADQAVRVESVSTVVTTTQDVVARSSRTDGAKNGDYTVLVGAYRERGARGETAVATAVFDQKDSTDQETTEVASVQLQSGWAYVIARPPRWPVVRTPRVRGGVPAASSVDVYVLAYADGAVERIIYVGASGAGAPALTVDVNQSGPPSPAAFTINTTFYAERKLDLNTGVWGPLTPGAFPVTDINCPQEVRDLVRFVQTRVAGNSLTWPAGVVIP